jgi:hypothetical protein
LEERQVEFVHSDVLRWKAENAYDLIVTNFFLDCFQFEQLARVISEISSAATPDAHWLISDFQIPPGGLKRIRARMIIWVMYVFFRVMTRLPARRITAPGAFLKRTGFTLHRRTESEWNLLYTDWWRRDGASPAGV